MARPKPARGAVPQIQLRALVELLPYARNARTHNAAQVTSLKASMQEWGWTNPVLVDGDGVVAGHGRIMAASELYAAGVTISFPGGAEIPPGMVPTIDCSGWSPTQRKSYILADNQLANLAGWDVGMLKLEVDELEAEGFDMELAGFSDQLLGELFMGIEPPGGDGDGDGDPDDVPEPPDHPVSMPGDVWVCGAHRVMCGNSTIPEDWDRLMPGEAADACFTDPPYNVDVGRKNRLLDKTLGGIRSDSGALKGDKMSEADFDALIRGAYGQLLRVLRGGATIYVAHSDKAGGMFRGLFEEVGFHFSQSLIWKKNVHVLGMSDFQPIHEPILYGWKPGSKHRWYGGRKNTTVLDMGDGGPFTRMEDGRWQIKVGDSVMVVAGDATVSEAPSSVIYEPKPQKSGLHPTQKPVALVERLLKQSARSGDLVVDAFGGSGTTMVAADRLGMSSRLMELDPRYVDCIVVRWQMLTGRRAHHAITLEPFPLEGEGRAEQPPEGEGAHDAF